MISRRLSKPLLILGCLLSPCLHSLSAAPPRLTLTAPLDYQVVQRETKDRGKIEILGALTGGKVSDRRIEARVSPGDWRRLSTTFVGETFSGTLEAPAGGWFRVEVRATQGSGETASAAVEHVGVGEVFVVAGQSNSANHGSEKQSSKTGRVTTFDGARWRIAHDPQPGASGEGGSFLPPLGDAFSEKYNVPVGFVSCGSGGTSVRHWLPKGTRTPILPTNETSALPSGEWESGGQLYDNFIARMKSLGPAGFRAVLWHQGESDANQKDTSRTLPGTQYRQNLEKIIRDSRRDLGREVPWFVAQASYHVPGDEASPDIRAAQESLWKDGIALEGPDTDQLKGDLRESDGQGVHFSGPGLREHSKLWVEKISPWLESGS